LGKVTKIPSKIAKLGVTVTDQDGVKVRYEHNDAGELVKAIAGFGSLNLTTQYAYDANHNLVQVTTPERLCLAVWL